MSELKVFAFHYRCKKCGKEYIETETSGLPASFLVMKFDGRSAHQCGNDAKEYGCGEFLGVSEA